ncbi:MAG: hypothetical protein V3T40_02785 [Nitrososphaerales archaeon]
MATEHLQLSSSEDQRPDGTAPVAVTMNQNDAISGIEHSTTNNPENIRILFSGVYIVVFAPQVGRTSGSDPKYVDFWLKKNGTNVPNSNIRLVVGGKDNKDVIVGNTIASFDANDELNVMMSIETAGQGLGIEAIRPPGEPLVPSIIFSTHKI